MSSEWVSTTLGAVTDWRSGGTPKKDTPSYWNGEIPWISANSMYGTRYSDSELRITHEGLINGSRLAPKDSVLLLVRGGALHNRLPVGITTRDVAFNQDVKALVAKKEVISPWYLLFWLMGQEKFLLNTVVEYTGIGAGKLDTKRMQGLEILLPSRNEQDAIVELIKAMDDRINLLRETNTTLEAIAQALFKSWFVDFDPVRAKMEGREPEGAEQGCTSVAGGRMPETTLDAETAALFPDNFEESELGLVPRGWKIGKVDTVLSRLSAKIRYTKDQVTSDGDTPIFEQGAGILLGYHEGKAQYQADENDPAFIFGDHTCVTHLSCEPFDISQNVIPLKGKDRATLWVFYAVKDKQSFQEYRRHWMELVVKDIIIPPAQICEAFAKTVNVFHLKMESNARQSRTLTTLRDTLLPRLISGQLRLPEAEALLETV